MKWSVYFFIVGAVFLLLFGYQKSEFSTQSSQETAVSHVSGKEESSYLNELANKDPLLQQEFTVLNQNENMNSSSVDKEDKQEDQGIVPTHLSIPAIDVDTKIEKVGVLDNGEMGVPDSTKTVGWFEPGTRPGNTGNAVIAGHVDSYKGPAVFFYLKNLEKGDEVTVTDQNGEKKTYVVKALESYPYDNAPIEEIFGTTDKKRLNLITCTGTFDQETRNHLERLVVYTELKDPASEKEQEPKEQQLPSPEQVEVNGTFVTWHAVRDENVIGYRVYRSKDGETFEKVASVSSFERKNYTDPDASAYTYYVTAVDEDGNESKPSNRAKAE
ncbi:MULTISPECIES: class F sortase [Pontibacillus]|uniref:Sortase n=1 Tax=Pontibacillus chungwhensis TaxID=265426 RepID=A0ABY8V2H3_9BACI|nr:MULTISPECIES: sortase [Pontibacillus]MCD5324509.1 sortase [Pontibacillus sp. HN14]WIF99196.1 sortase [Pontibacillus chungwhensis]